MASEDPRRDPVEVIRHARAYLKNTRGIARFNESLAATILNKAEKDSVKCIDYMISEKAGANGLYCPCDFHEQEFEEAQRLLTSPHRHGKSAKRDYKAAAAGEENQE